MYAHVRDAVVSGFEDLLDCGTTGKTVSGVVGNQVAVVDEHVEDTGDAALGLVAEGGEMGLEAVAGGVGQDALGGCFGENLQRDAVAPFVEGVPEPRVVVREVDLPPRRVTSQQNSCQQL